MTSLHPGGRELFILNFHGLGEPGPWVPEDELPYWCARDDWLSLADCMAELAHEDKAELAITFDDGNVSDVELALPSLLDRGLLATFFVCAGRIGQPGYLDARGMDLLLEAGMNIGSHGWAHVDLRNTNPEDLLLEARGSRVQLEELTGEAISSFAIPFGSYDRRVLRALRGYDTVFTSDGGAARGGTWLSPRTSYVKNWGPLEPARIVQRRIPVANRLRRRAGLMWKRWR